ncbi:unnamed protein product [Owenia fusiformis]|uniref:Uncharacterized protein n=1 Tax=Owenia fusiformis TaxID=6347 RepID=A0A8J1T785_OWEFU|nr:unnamed protein product [Owenia fusiformis]
MDMYSNYYIKVLFHVCIILIIAGQTQTMRRKHKSRITDMPMNELINKFFDNIDPNEVDIERDTNKQTETVNIINICNLDPDRGPCKRNRRRYYYNPLNNQCLQFSYGGCQGNSNNFLTQTACEKQCMLNETQICNLPVDNGQFCLEPTGERFSWDPAKKECTSFQYRGCRGNLNNHLTKESCLTKCGHLDICSLPKDTEDCDLPVPAFYFNSATRMCEQLETGKCQKNGNTFEKLAKCQDACRPTCKWTCKSCRRNNKVRVVYKCWQCLQGVFTKIIGIVILAKLVSFNFAFEQDRTGLFLSISDDDKIGNNRGNKFLPLYNRGLGDVYGRFQQDEWGKDKLLGYEETNDKKEIQSDEGETESERQEKLYKMLRELLRYAASKHETTYHLSGSEAGVSKRRYDGSKSTPWHFRKCHKKKISEKVIQDVNFFIKTLSPSKKAVIHL